MVESRCGMVCSTCKYKEEVNCKGCVNIDKPFWADTCPIKSCCEGKKLAHCGTCESFPCSELHRFSYDEKEGNNGESIEQCKRWCKE